jgi:hypothetical protein
VRPVREQLEHDRVIRLLQTRLRRKHEVAINVGAEQTTPVKLTANVVYPDVVLTSADRRRRLEGLIEVETGESVNHLEAMAQWAAFGQARVPFHLYVPSGSVDVARRLCTDYNVQVAEIWSYHSVGDQMRFALIQRAPVPKATAPRAPAARSRPAAGRSSGAPRSKPAARAAKRSGRKAPPAPARRTARKRK